MVPDVGFLVLWSENNDWTIYVFATGVGCKIRSVGSTELKNVPYLSSRAACTINISVKETSMLRLKIWMLSFLEENKYLTSKYLNKYLRPLFWWKKTYFKALNNQEEYFRRYENICCMIFLNNTLITLSHIVFNISLGLICDQCHPLHVKPQVFLRLFWWLLMQ